LLLVYFFYFSISYIIVSKNSRLVGGDFEGKLSTRLLQACDNETAPMWEERNAEMKTEIDRDNEALFNDMAHEYVRKILNIAEDRLLERQITNPIEVEEYLCRFYIEDAGSHIQGATYFLQSDATLGAEFFLLKCVGGFTERPHPIRKYLSPTRLRACGNQLSFHTTTYFPRYRAILTQRYVEELQQPDDRVLVGAGFNGILHLAAASLPGVREEMNRALRRRGLDYDAAKVPAAHLERRMRALGSSGRMIGKGH